MQLHLLLTNLGPIFRTQLHLFLLRWRACTPYLICSYLWQDLALHSLPTSAVSLLARLGPVCLIQQYPLLVGLCPACLTQLHPFLVR